MTYGRDPQRGRRVVVRAARGRSKAQRSREGVGARQRFKRGGAGTRHAVRHTAEQARGQERGFRQRLRIWSSDFIFGCLRSGFGDSGFGGWCGERGDLGFFE